MTAGPTPIELRAQAALNLGRYEDARREAEQARSDDPTSLAAHALLSQALFQLDRFQDALAAAETGLAQSPDSEWLHRLRASSLRQLGQGELALAAAEEAVRHGPNEPSGHIVLAYTLMSLNHRERARQAAERAVALAPDSAEAHATLGDTCNVTPRIANDHYFRSLALRPNNANVLNNLGVMFVRLGKHADANAMFKAALLVDPTSTIAKRNIHLAIRRQLRKTGAAVLLPFGATLLLFPLLFREGDDLHSTLFPLVAVALVLLNVITLVAYRRRLRTNQRWLEASDPQVLDIYRKLDAEKSAGRL